MSKVAVHLAEGFEEIEALTIVDILRRAEIETIVVSVTGNKMVKGAHNIKVEADQLFEDVDYDSINLLALPGGMPGSVNLYEHTELRRIIKSFHEQKKTLAAICAAPLVLGRNKLLVGEKATCYPSFESELTGATCVTEPVVESNHFITSRGPATAHLFALKIVEKIKGQQVAQTLKEGMLFGS